jgi:hypothetical protein
VRLSRSTSPQAEEFALAQTEAQGQHGYPFEAVTPGGSQHAGSFGGGERVM